MRYEACYIFLALLKSFTTDIQENCSPNRFDQRAWNSLLCEIARHGEGFNKAEILEEDVQVARFLKLQITLSREPSTVAI